MMMMTTILVISYHASQLLIRSLSVACLNVTLLYTDFGNLFSQVHGCLPRGSKMRQFLFRSGNPRFRLAKLGNDCRVHGREAPSSDLADWMVGKLFFD